MIHEDEKTEFGTIKIHNNVIASIAYLAALEVDGVSRICDNLSASILNLFGKKQNRAVSTSDQKKMKAFPSLSLLL